MSPEIQELVALTEKPYEEYNNVLATIHARLTRQQLATFEQVLKEELPITTGRRAFRAAVLIAMGEKDVFRDSVQIQQKRISRNKPKSSISS